MLLPLAAGISELMASKGTAPSLQVACMLNPLSATHKVKLATINSSNATSLLMSAQQLEPYSPVYATHLGNHHLLTRNLVPAIAALTKAMELQPMNIANYENAAYAAAEAANALYKTSITESTSFAEKVLEVEQKYRAIFNSTPPENLKRTPPFMLTPRFSVDIGRALSILGQKGEAWPYLLQVGADPTGFLAVSANSWLHSSFGYVYDKTRPSNLVPTLQSTAVCGTAGFARWHMAPLQAVTDSVWQQPSVLRGVVIEAGGHGIGTSIFGTISENAKYTASVYVKRSFVRRMYLILDWYTPTHANGYTAGTLTEVGDSWLRLTVTGTAPAGSTRVRLYLLSDSTGQPGDIVWADSWMLEEGASASPWLPGQFRHIN